MKAGLLLLLVCSLTFGLPAPVPLDMSLEKLLSYNDNVTAEHNNLAVIPNLQFDFVSMLKILAKYEIQEEAKKLDQSFKALTDKLRTFDDSIVQSAKSHPSTALSLVTLGGKKYFFSNKQRLSWMNAVSFCRLYGMELVSVETKEEDDLIKKHLLSIGLTVLNGESYTFISANKIGSATWQWLNGSPVTYMNWHPSQRHGSTTQHCIVYALDGTWADIECNDRVWHFICEQV